MTLEKKQIARQFSRAATTYDDVASVQALMATRLIEKIPIDARGTLIDLGCGTGAALKSLASQTRLELIGIDVAAGMLAQTRLRLERVSKKVVLLERDLENTGLENECADIVFSNAAIQWCQSRLAFAEMNRILRPGGQLFVSTFGPQTLCEWRQAWQAIGDTSARVHSLEPLVTLQENLKIAGFDCLTAETELYRPEFISVNDMLRSIKQLGATNASRDRAAGLLGREKFLRLTNHFQNQLNDGVLSLSFECFFLNGRKSS